MNKQKEYIKKYFNEIIDETFDGLIWILKDVKPKIKELINLESLIKENFNCLLLGLNQASIFCSNHLLERLMKYSLIQNETINFFFTDKEIYINKLNEAKLKYDSKTLFETIKLVIDSKLISQEQGDNLQKLRQSIRNPYSHAEIAKINKNIPELIPGYLFSFNEVKKNIVNKEERQMLKSLDLPTYSPAIAQLYQELNSKEIALNYFKSILETIIVIDINLQEKRNNKHAST